MAKTQAQKHAEAVIALDAENKALKTELDKFRWIPVTARLPEPYEFVIIKIPRLKLTDIAKREVDYDHYVYVGGKGQYTTEDVVYWMPIPPLPEKGGAGYGLSDGPGGERSE